MSKKYFSEHTRSKHTYQFFKDRRNDPKWHDEYLEVRAQRNRSILINSILGVAVLVIGTVWWHNSTAQPKVSPETSSISSQSKPNKAGKTHSKGNAVNNFVNKRVKKVKKAFSSAESTISGQKTNSNKQQKVRNYILHKGYQIGPKLYDGQPIDQAMSEGKAPQNSVHDGTITIYFANSKTVQETLLGSYNPKFEKNYQVSQKEIIFDGNHIPYEINNDQVTFKNWIVKSGKHQFTYEMRPYPGAKEYIDNKPEN